MSRVANNSRMKELCDKLSKHTGLNIRPVGCNGEYFCTGDNPFYYLRGYHSKEETNTFLEGLLAGLSYRKEIYLFARTDAWHTRESNELVYATDNIENGIAQCMEHRGMTKEQAEDIRNMMQSQCNGGDEEWEVLSIELNQFCD